MKEENKTTRRDFIKKTSAVATGVALSNLNVLRPERVLGANGRVRVAMIGPGDRAKDALIPAFGKLAGDLNFEMVAVCDIWNRRRDEGAPYIAQKTGGKEPVKVRNTDELYAMKD